MCKGKIYISGKITGIERIAVSRFKFVKYLLELEGYEAINPMELPDNHNKSWFSYMKVCVKALKGCESIYMMDNWKRSKGAIIEWIIAKMMRIEIIYENKCIII